MSRRPAEIHLLRLVPGDTPVHRLWAGTKLVAVAGLSLALSLQPTWTAIGIGAGFVLLSLIVARIPPGAAPRLPRWFLVGLAIGAALSMQSSRSPNTHVFGFALSLGGLEEWTRLTAFALVILTAAALVSWTTPLAEVAPALVRLGSPLRRLRVPVDEWAITVALSIRCLPLLIDEVRTLAAARRLRQHDDGSGGRRWRRSRGQPQDLLVTALVVSLRRAHDVADAIEARGGFGMVSDSHSRPGRRRDRPDAPGGSRRRRLPGLAAPPGHTGRMSDADGLTTGEDGVTRCAWGASDPAYVTYHDLEWGRPSADDGRLFEKLCLEGFQAGLSWLTILRKRARFREVFSHFDIDAVARYTEADVERLLGDPGIVRHRGKIASTVNNARRAVDLRAECGSLAAYVWRFEPEEAHTGRPPFLSESAESRALSRDLKRRGWTFVGPTTVYAFMQAMGLVDDHLVGCAQRAGVEADRQAFRRPDRGLTAR